MRDAGQAAGRLPDAALRPSRADLHGAGAQRLPLSARPVRPIDDLGFATWLDRLGPFEPFPRVAVAVSGGADSLALAVLAQAWARARAGTVLALIVDHGLRPESGEEAELTAGRLAGQGIEHAVLRLDGLRRGSALAARARAARYAALRDACGTAGILHLLLGHQAADQAETRMMRLLRGSGPNGLAGMAALVETPTLRVLRPLLEATPGELRATLRAAGLAWVEDPSNRDRSSLRARLRLALADPEGTGPTVRWHADQAARLGAARSRGDEAEAGWLGRHARLHPEGYAVLLALPELPAPLGRIIQAVSGADHPPREAALVRWLRAPCAATLGGTVLRPAGRLAPGGWLVAREPASVAGGAGAWDGAIWDRRLRAVCPHAEPDARARRRLPAVVRRALPDPAGAGARGGTVCWWPRAALAGAGFMPARPGEAAGDAQPWGPPYVDAVMARRHAARLTPGEPDGPDGPTPRCGREGRGTT